MQVRACVAKKRVLVCVDLKVAFKEMLHQGTELKKEISILHVTHWVNIWTDRPITLPVCVRARMHVCVCVSVKFF